MGIYWVTKKNGQVGSIVGFSKESLLARKDIEKVECLPYAASPILETRYNNTVPLCMNGNMCKNKTSCPRNPSCSE